MKFLRTTLIVCLMVGLAYMVNAIDFYNAKALTTNNIKQATIPNNDKFTSFTTKQVNDKFCQLSWTLKYPQNHPSTFNIQKSSDGQRFSSVASINSNQSNDYQFDDISNTAQPIVYYRIVEVFEGEVMTESPVIVVKVRK